MCSYQEPYEHLPEDVRAQHRAMKSLVEEIEAVDWYNQRVATTKNEELKAILAHNRDEEMEHASMILEWLRRNMAGWDKELRDYLFTDKPLAHH
jgi:ferritin-like protein